MVTRILADYNCNNEAGVLSVYYECIVKRWYDICMYICICRLIICCEVEDEKFLIGLRNCAREFANGVFNLCTLGRRPVSLLILQCCVPGLLVKISVSNGFNSLMTATGDDDSLHVARHHIRLSAHGYRTWRQRESGL